ncbi:hypothetical protein Slin15195_G044790 [Septoria linicola]|uniref:Uncharacterized protein n=1 Tax=Septoria linicola TaxID=215465 RepID=A0A9Q9ARE5_9PEZI|nr:hypothetical protein Slin14017_G048310 [Septoria linicola]USW51160.1 hypothetical protein Slin15195_G044790 [Septoria linicola]
MKTQSPMLLLALAAGVAQCVPNNDIAARGSPGRHDDSNKWPGSGRNRAPIPHDWDRRVRLSVRDRDGDGYPREEDDDHPPPPRYGKDDDNDGPRGPKGGPKGKKPVPPHRQDDDREDSDRLRPEEYDRDHDEERPVPPHCYPGAPEHPDDNGPEGASCTEDELERAKASGQNWDDLDHPDHDEHPHGYEAGRIDKRQRNGGSDGPDGDGDGPDGDGDGPDGDDGGRDGFRNAAGRNTYPVIGGVVGLAVVMAAML